MAQNKSEWTQVRMEKSTLELVKKLGTYGESYNSIIKKVFQNEKIPYGHLGNRPANCSDPNNPKHVCYKDCL